MKSTLKPLSRKDNIVVQDVDDEILIYDLKRDKAFCLNQTSAIVWQACDGKRTIDEVCNEVGRRFGKSDCDDIVWLALDQLQKEKLIDGEGYFSERFEGLSRRDVIRKIGLTTAGALPVVASMIAPKAAHANSACMIAIGGCFCGTGDNQPSGMFCMPSGTLAMACADPNCRCLSMGTLVADDCVP